MSDFLKKIRQSVLARVDKMPELVNATPNKQDFCVIFDQVKEPVVIAEVKFASPSRGRIYQGSMGPVDVAKDYLANGASALSVLAEPEYFQGNIDYIELIKEALPVANIVLKDFVLSKKQIAQGLIKGVNAVLLIVAFLEEGELKELYEYGISLGLTPIIEVHSRSELEVALRLKPQIIGVNNRNLRTLEIDLNTSRELITVIPEGCYAICESGIETREQIDEMRQLGFDGFLVGSSLMKHESPGGALKKLLNGGSYEG